MKYEIAPMGPDQRTYNSAAAEIVDIRVDDVSSKKICVEFIHVRCFYQWAAMFHTRYALRLLDQMYERHYWRICTPLLVPETPWRRYQRLRLRQMPLREESIRSPTWLIWWARFFFSSSQFRRCCNCCSIGCRSRGGAPTTVGRKQADEENRPAKIWFLIVKMLHNDIKYSFHHLFFPFFKYSHVNTLFVLPHFISSFLLFYVHFYYFILFSF